MKLKIVLILLTTQLFACAASNTRTEGATFNVQPYGDDTYITTAGSAFSLSKAVNKAVGEANSFCLSRNQRMEPVSRETTEIDLKEIILYFRCK